MQHYFTETPDAPAAAGTATASTAPASSPTLSLTRASATLPGTPGPVQRVTIAGDDLDHARRTYQDAYGGAGFTVSPGDTDFSFRYASAGDDRVSLRTSTMAGHLSGEVPHLKEYVVSWFRSGGGELQRQRSAQVGEVSGPFLLPSEQRFAFSFAPHRQHLVHFSPDFLEGVATEFHAGTPRAVSFDHDALPARDAVTRWREAVSAATTVLLDVAATPLLRMNAQLPLARALLHLFPWYGLDMPQILRDPPMARTRVALEYLHHHAHEPITPADAASAAGLHTRTFQQATRRHLGMSPSAYLRGIRLDRARRDLSAATPETSTVSAVARDWGFGHMGRFSSAYQVAFGERPCDTLRR